MATVVASASAQQGDLPGDGWFTVLLIQNVSSTVNGSLTLEAFATTGAATSGDRTSQSFAFDATRSLLQYSPAFAPNYATGGNRIGFTSDLDSGFVGSAVASSDVDIRAVLQLGNNPTGTAGVTGGLASAFSQGIGQDGASTSIFFPSMKRTFPAGATGQSNLYMIQAVSDASVTVTYSYAGGTSTQGPIAIAANRQYTFSPANATPAIPAGTLGSVTVTSTSGAIVGTSVEYLDAGIPGKFAQSTRSFTAADADTTLYAPTWKKAFTNSATTGLTIQNTGGAATTVDVVFTVTNVTGAAVGVVVKGDVFRIDDMSLDSNASKTISGFNINTSTDFARPTMNGSTFTVPDGVFASVTVTSDSANELVAIMNESQAGEKRAQSQVFGAVAGSMEVSLPIVKEVFPQTASTNGNTTSMSIQNVGSVATDVTVVFMEGGTTRTYTFAGLGAGEGAPMFRCSQAAGCAGFTGEAPLPNKLYAVQITSSASPIVVLATETQLDGAAASKIDMKNYEGFATQ